MKLKFLIRMLPDRFGKHAFYYNQGTPIVYTRLKSTDIHDLETIYFSVLSKDEIFDKAGTRVKYILKKVG